MSESATNKKKKNSGDFSNNKEILSVSSTPLTDMRRKSFITLVYDFNESVTTKSLSQYKKNYAQNFAINILHKIFMKKMLLINI